MPETPLEQLLAQQKQFLAFVQRRVSDSGLAEDILQTAYLRAFEHQDDFKPSESAVAWFYRLLRNAPACMGSWTGSNRSILRSCVLSISESSVCRISLSSTNFPRQMLESVSTARAQPSVSSFCERARPVRSTAA
jgi:hypothetical protein